jgi:hypothetical protein
VSSRHEGGRRCDVTSAYGSRRTHQRSSIKKKSITGGGTPSQRVRFSADSTCGGDGRQAPRGEARAETDPTSRARGGSGAPHVLFPKKNNVLDRNYILAMQAGGGVTRNKRWCAGHKGQGSPAATGACVHAFEREEKKRKQAAAERRVRVSVLRPRDVCACLRFDEMERRTGVCQMQTLACE